MGPDPRPEGRGLFDCAIYAIPVSEIVLDKGAHRRPFRPKRPQNALRPSGPRQGGARHSNPRQAAGNARSRYESYMSMARDAASRGDTIEAENLYQQPSSISELCVSNRISWAKNPIELQMHARRGCLCRNSAPARLPSSQGEAEGPAGRSEEEREALVRECPAQLL